MSALPAPVLDPLSPAAGWTPERVALLLQYVADGDTGSIAAGKLGVTRSAAIAKADKLGSPFNGGRKSRRPMGSLSFLESRPKPPPLKIAKHNALGNGAITRKLQRGHYDPKPQKMPAFKPIPLQCEPVPISGLKLDSCKAVIGDPNGAETLWCGAKIVRGSYCGAHAARYYKGVSK